MVRRRNFSAIAPQGSEILGDPTVRAGIQADLIRLQADGTLAGAVDGAWWMTTVDAHGGPLDPGEVSGLHSFVRLLSETNQPMDCSIDLGLVSLDFSFGNLAVSTLDLIATTDASTLQTTGSVYSILFGNDVGAFVLDEAANLGVCPGLTPQVVDDLAAVELLADPNAGDLLTAFVSVISTLEAGETDRLPALADLAQNLYLAGGWLATEELLRDLAPQPVIEDVLAVIPVLADPARFGVSGGTSPPADLQAALDLLAWLVDADPSNSYDGTPLTGFDKISPLLESVVTDNGVWISVDRAAALARNPESQRASVIKALPDLLATDPDLVLLSQVSPLFSNPSVAGPVLRLAQTPGLLSASMAVDPGQPLDFAGRLIAGGSLEDTLVLVDLVFGTLGG